MDVQIEERDQLPLLNKFLYWLILLRKQYLMLGGKGVLSAMEDAIFITLISLSYKARKFSSGALLCELRISK